MYKNDSEEFVDAILAISDTIRRLRIEKKMSQAELAALIGVRQPVVSRIEKGIHTPTWRTLQKIADALGAKLTVDFQLIKY